MKYLVPQRLRFEKDIVIRIKRTLTGKGKINVTLGTQVSPSDIIGSSQVSSGFRTLNLSQLLSTSSDSVNKYLKKQIGQKVYKDELLAYKDGGLFGGKKIVVSPTDGILEYINPKTGEVKMTFLPKRVDLPSGVFGIVERIDEHLGLVIIKTQVSRIYGLFGSGRTRDGKLVILGRREGLINKSDISSKFDGNVLVGGSLVFKDAMSDAISVGINGIITGGINAKDYKSMAGGRITFPRKLENDIGISFVVCEGFGSIPIGEDIYKVLSEYNGKFVSLEGNRGIINLPSSESKSIARVKSTELQPIPDNIELDIENQTVKVSELNEGNLVRVIGNSYAGEQGKVLAIDKVGSILPSGVKTPLVTIETPRRKIQIPVANLEIIS